MPHVEIHTRKGFFKPEQKNEVARQIAAILRDAVLRGHEQTHKYPIYVLFMEHEPNDYEEV